MTTDREQWNLDREAERRDALAEFKKHHPESMEEPMIEALAATAATEQAQMIADCCARVSRLSTFEIELLVMLKSELDRGTALPAQLAEALSEVWERATAKG